MSVTLTDADVARLSRLSSLLLSPLDADRLDDWRQETALTMSELVGSDAVFFLASDLDGEDVMWERQLPPPVAHAYRSRFRDDEGSRRAVDTGRVAYNQDMIVAGDWAGYHRDPTVNELFKPFRIDDVVGMVTEVPRCDEPGALPMRFQLGSVRTPYGTELFADKGLVMMQLLAPAFLAAVGTLAETHLWRRALGQSFDLLDTPAWVFTPNGQRVAYRNTSVATLDADDPQAALVHSVAAAVAHELGSTSRPAKSSRAPTNGVAPVARVRTAAASYLVRGCYVGPARLGPGPTILVVARRTSARPPAAEALREQHSLTAREIDVARLVWEGLGPIDVARRLGISVHTARRHMERLYTKLGVHSHADAHRLLHQL